MIQNEKMKMLWSYSYGAVMCQTFSKVPLSVNVYNQQTARKMCAFKMLKTVMLLVCAQLQRWNTFFMIINLYGKHIMYSCSNIRVWADVQISR